MRVVQILGPGTSGIGWHVASLASRLSAAGCDVTVAGPRSTREKFGFGVPFVAAEITGIGAPMHQLAVATDLRPLLSAADVVHAHGHLAGFVASSARRRRVPLIVSWHNTVLATGAGGLALRGVRRGVARRATIVLGASPDLVEDARRLGAADARLAPVPAPPLPPPLRTPTEVRTELGLGDRRLVLAVGGLSSRKAYDVLLDASALLAKREEPPLVVIAGDGPERERLADRIRTENLPVRLLGDRSDVPDLLSAADAVVLTSRWESTPQIAQEALRAGVPLVATRVGGLPALVDEAALLVPPNDDGAVGVALGRVLDEPMLSRRLVAAGVKQSASWLTEDDTAAHILTIYHEVAGI